MTCSAGDYFPCRVGGGGRAASASGPQATFFSGASDSRPVIVCPVIHDGTCRKRSAGDPQGPAGARSAAAAARPFHLKAKEEEQSGVVDELDVGEPRGKHRLGRKHERGVQYAASKLGELEVVGGEDPRWHDVGGGGRTALDQLPGRPQLG